MAFALSEKIQTFFRKLPVKSMPNRATSIGISIGTSSIKIVELERHSKDIILQNLAVLPLPENSLVNREIANHIAVVEEISKGIEQLGFQGRQVSLTLSGPFVLVKRLQVQVNQKKDLQNQAFWEAEQYLPFDSNDAVFDCHPIQWLSPNLADVLVIAVKKTVLESYMDCVRQAGLLPTLVDIDYLSLMNAFHMNYNPNPGETVLIVDVGAAGIKIVIVADRLPIFTKDIPFGGNDLTKQIQSRLHLSFSDAEALKVGSNGVGIPQEVHELTAQYNQNIVTEIRKVLDVFRASKETRNVTYALIAGGGARTAGFIDKFEDEIGLTAQRISSFMTVNYNSEEFNPDFLEQYAMAATSSVGVAKRTLG